MQRRNSRAADRRLALALLAALAWGGACLAEEPVAGTPAAARVLETSLDLQLEVIVNGAPSGFVAAFRRHDDGRLTIEAEQLENCGIRAAPDVADDEGRIDIGKLPGVSFLYDEKTQTITFTAEQKGLATRKIEMSGVTKPETEGEDERLKPVSSTGALVNYTLFGATGGEDVSGLWDFQGLSGSFDMRVFGPLGTLSSSQIVNLSSNDRYSTARLDTSWTYSDPDRILTYRAGDLITGALSWTRPTRLGGLQIQRNFDLRSDIVTMPLPDVAGSAAVPSTVDLYIDDARRSSYDVPAGPFSLNNIPSISGNATARLVVRDALGRETVTETPLYASADLLAEGLFDYSAELGFARRNYGMDSFSYDERLIGLATGRYGLSDRLTLEGHVEGGMDFISGGIGAAVALGSIGIGTGAVSASRFGDEQGYLVAASIEGEIFDIHWRASTQRTLGEYNDVASVTADRPKGVPAFRSGPPKALDQLNLSVPLRFDDTTLNFSLTHAVTADEERSRIVGVTANRSIGERGNLFVTAYADLDHRDALGVFAGLTWSFENDVIASSGVSSDKDGFTVTSDLSRREERLDGEVDWRLSDVEGSRTSRAATVSYRRPTGRVEGHVEQAGKGWQARGQLEGAVVLADRDVFLADRVDDAFGIVDAGGADVEVQFENRPVGKTNSRGRLLIPDLRAYEPNNVSIDPSNLPINSTINSTREVVMPHRGSGVVVKFDVEADIATALVTLKAENGDYVETGAVVTPEGSGDSFVVGYDGQAFLTGLTGKVELTVQQAFIRNMRGRGRSRRGRQCAGERARSNLQEDPMKTFLAAALLVLAAATTARAQSCSYSVTNVNFGTVNLLSGSAIDSSATIQATCGGVQTLNLSVRICFNFGAGSGGTTGSTRTMANGSNRLQYQLYQDAARTIPWGHTDIPSLGTPGTLDFLLLPTGSVTYSKTIYARILGNQPTTPGGFYTSLFSGAQARFNAASFTLVAPACTAVTSNPVTPTFSVNASVDRTCTVTAQDLDFGRHGVLRTQTDASSQLTVSCTSGLPYTVGLNGGSTNQAPTARRMSGNGQFITYGLYRNSARSLPWGDTAGTMISGTGTGVGQNLAVYGRVPVQTTPSPGLYSDTVAVTVTY